MLATCQFQAFTASLDIPPGRVPTVCVDPAENLCPLGPGNFQLLASDFQLRVQLLRVQSGQGHSGFDMGTDGCPALGDDPTGSESKPTYS